MINAAKVGQVMGIKTDSLADLRKKVMGGLPLRTFKITIDRITGGLLVVERNRLRDRIIPPATYHRRRTVLKAHESEQLERVARVFALALDVWDDEDDARQFLFTPHPLLENERPIDLALSDLGARQVEQVLERLRWGLPA